MKKWICLFLAPILWANAQRKEITLNDLIFFTSCSIKEFNAFAGKHGFNLPKGFRHSTEPFYINKQSAKDKIHRSIIPTRNDMGSMLLFRTEIESEFTSLKTQADALGFRQIIEDKPAVNETRYQKLDLILIFRIKREEDKRMYEIRLERTRQNHASSYVYAEDLLQVESHETLMAVFGVRNVKRDTLYMDENQFLPVTVLFPDTYSEALLIWSDKINEKKVEMIVIGEKLKRNSWKGSQQNKWYSKQGIHLGMPLKELINANNEHFNLYGLHTDYPGFIVPDSPGSINFKKLGIQLNCLDCSDEKEFTSKATFTSLVLLSKTDRVFVEKMVILQ